MITIIIAVLLLVYIIKNHYRLSESLIVFGSTAAIVLVICAILVPMAGFTEPVEMTVELMPLRLEQATDKEYYLEYNSKDGYYYYAYDNSEEYGLSGGAYEKECVHSTSSVKIYESEDCTTPILKRYKSKSKISWYSLAGMWSSEEYVFYIPLNSKYEEK